MSLSLSHNLYKYEIFAIILTGFSLSLSRFIQFLEEEETK
jgi:hypothetical protein